MTDWANAALPVATLILGSVLTMAGQALGDRRTATRERRARREAFRASNFEMHRAAMLEMQETVRECYQAFLDEKQRREEEGFYKYFERGLPFRRLNEDRSSMLAADNTEELMEAIRAASSDEERHGLMQAAIQSAEERTKTAERDRTEMMKLERTMEPLYPFWKRYVEFIHKLRLSMYRSGSNSVVNCGEAFIRAIYPWNDCYASARMDELVEQVRKSRYELDRALANALAFGPYDTYGNQSKVSR